MLSLLIICGLVTCYNEWMRIAAVDSSIDVLGIVYTSSSVAIAVGNDNAGYGSILRTSNAGSTWSIIESDIDMLTDVAMVVDTNTYVLSVSTSGAIWQSSDNGATFGGAAVATVDASLYGVAIGSNKKAYACGSYSSSNTYAKYSVVFTSTFSSGYATWDSGTSPSSSMLSLKGITSYDGISIITVGNSGKIYTSADSGATWTTRSSGVTSHLYTVSSTSSSVAMAAGMSGTVLKTSNGGSSWSAISDPIITSSVSFRYHCLSMLSSTVIYLGGSNGAIYVSTNGGTSWEYDNYYISAGNPIYSLAVYSTTAGLAGSMKNSNGFYKRVNSPSSTPTGHPSPKPVVGLVPTFQPTAIPTATLINGAFIAKATGSTLNAYVSATWLSSTICIMVGSQDSDGLISVSTNAGSTWSSTVISSDFDLQFTDVHRATISSTRYILAVNDAGGIYLSTNSGSTWTLKATVATELRGVYIGSNGFAYAVGARRSIYKSDYTSSFSTWTTITYYSANVVTLNDVFSFDGVNFIAVGNGGNILKSSNSGTSYTAVSVGGVSSNLYCISGLSNLYMVAAGADGKIIKTINGGATWSTISSSPITSSVVFQYHAISYVSTAIIFAAATNGKIYVSKDTGITWSLYQTTSDTTFNTLNAFSSTVAVAGDANGNAYLLTSIAPTYSPTVRPSPSPTLTGGRTFTPTLRPTTAIPTGPTIAPTAYPTNPTGQPTSTPSMMPTSMINSAVAFNATILLDGIDLSSYVFSDDELLSIQNGVVASIELVGIRASDVVVLTGTVGSWSTNAPTEAPTQAPAVLALRTLAVNDFWNSIFSFSGTKVPRNSFRSLTSLSQLTFKVKLFVNRLQYYNVTTSAYESVTAEDAFTQASGDIVTAISSGVLLTNIQSAATTLGTSWCASINSISLLSIDSSGTFFYGHNSKTPTATPTKKVSSNSKYFVGTLTRAEFITLITFMSLIFCVLVALLVLYKCRNWCVECCGFDTSQQNCCTYYCGCLVSLIMMPKNSVCCVVRCIDRYICCNFGQYDDEYKEPEPPKGWCGTICHRIYLLFCFACVCWRQVRRCFVYMGCCPTPNKKNDTAQNNAAQPPQPVSAMDKFRGTTSTVSAPPKPVATNTATATTTAAAVTTATTNSSSWSFFGKKQQSAMDSLAATTVTATTAPAPPKSTLPPSSFDKYASKGSTYGGSAATSGPGVGGAPNWRDKLKSNPAPTGGTAGNAGGNKYMQMDKFDKYKK